VCVPVQATARDVATGQVRGTPRGSCSAKLGVAFDDAIAQVTEALEKRGGSGTSFRLDSNASWSRRWPASAGSGRHAPELARY
jgi:hypothetical protein